MSNEVRIGLIGAGKWGKNYINTLKKNKKVSLKPIAIFSEKSFLGIAEITEGNLKPIRVFNI